MKKITKRIDKNSPLPLYYQLKQILQEMIDNEELQPGDVIPPERELCEVLGISRMTARKAVMELVSEGILYREQGKGTFVSQPKPQHRLNQLRGFTEEMEEKGLSVETKLLSFSFVPATVALKRELKLYPHQEEVIEIQRLRIVDGVPFALETVWLNPSRVQGLSQEDLNGGSLYTFLKENFQLIPSYATQTIEPTQLNEIESDYLTLPVGSLALLFRRTTYIDQEQVMEVTKCIYRTDKHKYEVLLTL